MLLWTGAGFITYALHQNLNFLLEGVFEEFVGELLDKKDETSMKVEIFSDLRLNQILEHNVEHLSSGEFHLV